MDNYNNIFTDNLYQVRDLFLAALIHSQKEQIGVKFIGARRVDHTYYFIFENISACKDIINRYYANEVLGDIKKYVDSYRAMKELIISGQTID